MADEQRRWFTLTELLVCIVLFGLIVALLGPNMDEGRERARLTTCYNNLRQLALANIERATRDNQVAFGGYLEPLKTAGDQPPDEDPTTESRELMVAWPTRLLPSLDSMTLYQKIVDSIADDASLFAQPPATGIFLCPSDSQLEAVPGGLSYVVNSGMPDLISPSESQPSDLKANGVCHDQRPGRFGPQVRMTDVKDGQSYTILLSENIHRDPPGSAKQPGNTWLRPAAGATNLEQWYGIVWVVDPQHPRSPQPSLLDRFNRDTRPESQRDQPYAASGTRFARPASNHPDVFNAAFCEGNTRTISQDIDYAVYQQMMTPDGQKAAPADAPNQRFEKTLPDDQRFMNPPLTDADY